MRKLQTSDVFNAMRLIKKANLKEEIRPILLRAGEGNLNVEEIGIEGILGFIEIITEKKSEQAIYEVLAGPFELKPQEIESMPLDLLVENLQQLAKENDIKSFFSLLSGLNKKV